MPSASSTRDRQPSASWMRVESVRNEPMSMRCSSFGHGTSATPPGDPVASTEFFGSPEMLAKSLFNDFVLPFEIASVLLLVAIVGAVVLAKRERAVR